MDNTQIRVDEPRKNEREAYRVVLLDGESFKGKGEIKDIKLVRLGGPEYRYERQEPKGMEVPLKVPNAAASQKSEKREITSLTKPSIEGVSGHLLSRNAVNDASRQARGVRVIDLTLKGKAIKDRRRLQTPSIEDSPSGENQASEKEDDEKEGGTEERRRLEARRCQRTPSNESPPSGKGSAFKRESRKEKFDSKVKEEERLRRDMNNSIREGSFTTASSSIVSSYSTPFALALNASNSEIGLLSSVQNLAGILSQFPGAMLTRSMTRKKIWVLCTILSRLFLIPLIFIGLFFSGTTEIWVLIILLGLVSFFSTMRGPAWSSMMGDLVPQERRGRYFGKRNMVIGSAGMVATLAAGAAVYNWGFPAIFAAAVLLSLLSITFLVKMREPQLRHERVYHYRLHFHPSDLIYQIKTNRNFAIFTVYMTVVNFGVNVAAPFAAVYMLRNLDVGYGWFAVLVTIGALVQILSMRYWGSNCDKYGNRKILVISGILICFVPLGYMLSTNVFHLVLLKVYDGFVWGAFDLVVFNYLLAVTPSEKRPGFVANHNFVTGAGTVLGALFGGFLAYQFQSGGFWMYGLQLVFLISFILRTVSIAFLPKISEVEMKESERVPVRYVFWDTVAIGPAKGIEHAVTSAFRYPYSVKIKSKLGLNNNRKIKISKKNFGSGDAQKTFKHIGVLPVKKQQIGGLKKEGGIAREGGTATFNRKSAFSQESGVWKMALGDKKQKTNEEEYVELGVERQAPKTAKIVVHHLQRFAETDKVVKSIRAKNVVFVGLKGMKQTNMDDLKQAVAKINKACIENGSNLSLVDDEWLIITPQTAAIV